jgi:hypothetical protein
MKAVNTPGEWNEPREWFGATAADMESGRLNLLGGRCQLYSSTTLQRCSNSSDDDHSDTRGDQDPGSCFIPSIALSAGPRLNLSGSKGRIIVVSKRFGFVYVDCKQT